MKKTLTAIVLGIALTLGLISAAAPQAQALVKCYKVTYHSNTEKDKTKPQDTCFHVTGGDSQLPVLKGESLFKGANGTHREQSSWNTKADGSGTKYKLGQEAPPQNLVLYAQWKLKTYSVTYKKGTTASVTNMPTKSSATALSSKTISSKIPKRKYYEFTGWKKSGDSKTVYPKGHTFKNVTGSITLTAQWKRTHYLVDYNLNGSGAKSNGVKDQWVKNGTGTTVDSDTPTRTHYVFAQWNTKKGGGGTAYQPGDSIASRKTDLDLYAQWTQTEFQISYDKNKGKGSIPKAVWKKDGEQVTVTDKTLTRKGYDFVGWNTKKDGTGTTYKAGAKITVSKDEGNIKLYAKWYAPTQTPKPKITGTVKVGKTLTAVPGEWHLNGVVVTDLKYQWYADGKAIPGATKSTLTLRVDGTSAETKKSPSNHYGKAITVKVTGTEGAKSVTKTSSKTKDVAKGTFTASLPELNSPYAGKKTDPIQVWQSQSTSEGTVIYSTPLIAGRVTAECEGICNPVATIKWERKIDGTWKTVTSTIRENKVDDAANKQKLTNASDWEFNPATYFAKAKKRTVVYSYTVKVSGYGYTTWSKNVKRTCDDTTQGGNTTPFCLTPAS